jgi:hypothetical protein
MSISKIQNRFSVVAGLLIAPTVWAINMQLSEILPDIDCVRQSRWSASISFVGAAAAVLGGAISWRWADQARLAAPLTSTSRFVASLGALSALVFAFALSMQGIASLVLSGCER